MSSRSKRNLSESPESVSNPNPRKILSSDFTKRRSEVKTEMGKNTDMDSDAKLDWIMAKLTNLVDHVTKTLTRLDKLEVAVEDIRKEQVSKSLVIFGLTEPDGETHNA